MYNTVPNILYMFIMYVFQVRFLPGNMMFEFVADKYVNMTFVTIYVVF